MVDLPFDQGSDYCLHTLSVISMLDRDLAVVSLPLMPVHLYQLLRERGVELIEIDAGEWDSLAPNVLALGPRDAVMLAGNPRTAAKLRAAGCRVQELEGSDVAIKGSGGPTCLTLPLQRTPFRYTSGRKRKIPSEWVLNGWKYTAAVALRRTSSSGGIHLMFSARLAIPLVAVIAWRCQAWPRPTPAP